MTTNNSNLHNAKALLDTAYQLLKKEEKSFNKTVSKLKEELEKERKYREYYELRFKIQRLLSVGSAKITIGQLSTLYELCHNGYVKSIGYADFVNPLFTINQELKAILDRVADTVPRKSVAKVLSDLSVHIDQSYDYLP